MRFSTVDLYIVSFSSSEFCNNRYIENRTLHTGANKNWPYILHFSSDLYKIRYRIMYSESEFSENGRSEKHTLFTGEKEFLPQHSTYSV